jgi:hypothetical protein
MENLTLTTADLADLNALKADLAESGDLHTILFVTEHRARLRGETLRLQTTGTGWSVALIADEGTAQHWTAPTLKAALVQSFADS